MFYDCNIPRGSVLRKCRLCFDNDKLLIYIYEVSGSLKNVARTITDVLNYEVVPEDHFPPFVCFDCSDKLYAFKAFKVKCDTSREAYKMLLNSSVENEKIACSTLKKESEEDPNSRVIETGKSLCTNIKVDGSSSVAETGAIVERNISKLNCNEYLKSPLKVDFEEQEVPICNELSPVIVRAFPIEAEQSGDDAGIDGSVQKESKLSPVIVREIPIEAEQTGNGTTTDGPEQKKVQEASKRRPLRCRKVVDYKQYLSDSDVSESSNSFCPSEQHGSESSDGSLNLGRDPKSRKKLKNSGEEVDPGLSGNNAEIGLLSGTVEMKKIFIGGNNNPLFDSRALAAVGNNAMSSLNDGFSRDNSNNAFQSSGMEIEPSYSHITHDSVSSQTTTPQSNVGLSTIDMSCKDLLKSIQSVEKVSSALDAKQTVNNYCFTDKQSVSNFTLIHSDKNDTPCKERVERYQSESITLKGPLEFEQYSAKVKSSLYSSVPNSLDDLLEKAGLSNNVKRGVIQLREEVVDAAYTSESNANPDSAGASESHSLQIREKKSAELADLQQRQSGTEAHLKRRIGMLDLKSFGISLEKENDDPVHNIIGGSNVSGEHYILGMNTESKKEIMSSECNSLDFGREKLTGDCNSSNLVVPGCMNVVGSLESSRVREVAVVHEDQRRVAERSVELEENRRVISDFHTEENSTEVAKDSIPWSTQPMSSTIDSSLSSLQSTLSNFRYETGNKCTQNGANYCISNPSNVFSVASEGHSTFHQMLANTCHTTIKQAYPTVVNISATNTCSTSNLTHSGISGNFSCNPGSTCERSLLRSSKQSLSVNSNDLSLQKTSGNVSFLPNFVSGIELEQNRTDVEEKSMGSEASTTDEGEISNIKEDCNGQRISKGEYTKERLCELCGKVYENQLSLKSHKKSVHGEKNFKCKECPKIFTMKHHLIQHLSMHIECRPFSCKECGNSFKLKTHLKQHVLVHSKKLMYQCAHCELGFRTKWQHDNHQNSHEGKVVWSCEGCAEKLKTWAEYVHHLHQHNKNRTYKCGICLKDYNSKLSLRKHMETHMRPFGCSVCGKHFGARRVLKNHKRIHTGERPFVCKVCGKTYSHSGGLFQHKLTHSETKRFKCSFCDYWTNYKTVLKKHETRKHQESQPEINLPHL